MKKVLFSSLLLSGVLLVACTSGESAKQEPQKQQQQETTNAHSQHAPMDHSQMQHNETGELPAGLHVKQNPTFAVGSEAILTTDHMPGMDGAVATIVGAYDTFVYTVSYEPMMGGAKVTNHKWVVHEEIQNAGEAPLAVGTEVTLQANHLQGMNGAKATIDSAEQTTVYMVDYAATTGEQVKNHQWVVESELKAK